MFHYNFAFYAPTLNVKTTFVKRKYFHLFSTYEITNDVKVSKLVINIENSV